MSATSFPRSGAGGRRRARTGRLARVRATLARVPRAAWVCAAIACANAVCWAATTPPYWIPDEVASMGYVQYVAENGDVPRFGSTGDPSQEQRLAYSGIPFSVEGRPSWLEAGQRNLFEVLSSDPERTSPGQAAYLANYPPLYYGLAAIPYRVAYEANFLDRLFAVRLFSALLGGLTVLFVFMFLRELLPASPWAWTVGALAAAFQPMFGFMTGGVTNDALLYTASALLFFLMARAFRRGLDPKLGIAIGAAVAIGLLTKQTMLGLLPGVGLGLALMVWRTPPPARRAALKGVAAAAAVGLLPWAAWLVTGHLILDRTTSETGGVFTGGGEQGPTLAGQLSYLWQAFLPRLPFMGDFFDWYVPWQIYFQGFIGRFGWVQYGFPLPFYRAALALFAALAVLVGRELWRRRATLRERWAEPLTYAAMLAGLLLLIEVAAYSFHVGFLGQYFEQGRYLLPMLCLYGAFVALAARAAGRRWGPALGAFLVVLAMGHSLFAQLMTIARFYG
jgi:4-amino-4-deoxy-L-arabinose transferase-like glycosyltransferase